MLSLSTDPIERARLTFIKLSQSIGRTQVKSGWSSDTSGRYGLSESTNRILRRASGLKEVVQVLRQVVIEEMDWKELLDKYKGPEAYFYLDPPYLATARTGGVRYATEFRSTKDHVRLLSKIITVNCYGWMLSGYDNALYNGFLFKAIKHSKSTKTQGNTHRQEVIWRSDHGHEKGLF